MFYLVCFDIVDDRIRAKTVKVLKEYGKRVQKSVFECPSLKEKQFLKMKSRIEDLIDSSDDTVRYYFVCKACLNKMEYSGVGEKAEEEEYRIV